MARAAKKGPVPPPRNDRQDRLLRFVERMEELEERKRSITADLGFVKKEAKLAGFDLKTIAQMIRERQMEPEERRTYQALCEMYRAALGMLDGTPLGDAARRRLLPPDPDQPSPDDPDNPRLGFPADESGHSEAMPATASPSADDVKAARAEGAEAAGEGKMVTSNPYGFDDPRRAAWDEGWCATAGNDGMEIPEAWRRKSRKPGSGKGKGA